RTRWAEYSQAKDQMFEFTDTKNAPWWVVPSDDKRSARLNCIRHLLSQVPYEKTTYAPVELPPLNKNGYLRIPYESQTLVPDFYGTMNGEPELPDTHGK
ncbi:MAG: hypothetical protein ACRCYJ_14545, partial [Plesiomonas shigelloides]